MDNIDSVNFSNENYNPDFEAEVSKALEDFTIEHEKEFVFVFDDPNLAEEGLEAIEVYYRVDTNEWFARNNDEESCEGEILIKDREGNYYFEDNEISLFDSVILTKNQFEKFESIVSEQVSEFEIENKQE